MSVASALYVGTVRHRRHRPVRHAFRHRAYQVLLSVDELPRLDRELRGFGYGRRALTTFHDEDHFGPASLPVREKLARWSAERGVALPAGPVYVLTNLRVLGHVFNPVSWWFCHRPDGTLAFVVAEVHNTFGEGYAYLLDDLERRGDGTLRASAAKAFHVSPFLPVDELRYHFTIRPPSSAAGGRVLLDMHVDDHDGRVFDATLSGRRVELDSRSLARVLVTHPLMPLRTVVLIHAHALALWRERVPSFRKPAPPADGFPAVGTTGARREQVA